MAEPGPDAWQPRVLVVEDSATRRTAICDWLGELGFSWRAASNGRHALDILIRLPPEERPDLILTDFHMPEMGGPELIQALAKRDSTCDIAVILYSTSVLENPAYAQGLKSQTEDLLHGAIEFDALASAVEKKITALRSLRRLAHARQLLK